MHHEHMRGESWSGDASWTQTSWDQACQPSPQEVKVGLGVLFEPKHDGLGHIRGEI